MTDTPVGVPVPIASEASVHVARARARQLAGELGWGPTRTAELETAVSEVATNTWVHAGGGAVEFAVRPARHGPVVVVVARDRGPGIADLDLAMREGASTAGTLGLGLAACTRLMDDVQIETTPGVGTTITMTKAERRPPEPLLPGRGLGLVDVVEGPDVVFGNLVWARASRPEGSGVVCGDDALVRPTRHGEVVAVADGAGHGPSAAAAAEVALTTVARYAEAGPAEILERCHEALSGTDGAAVSVLKVDSLSNTLRWAGIGNVEAAIFSEGGRGPHSSLVPRAGTLGFRIPRPKEQTVELDPDDRIVLWTDGVRASAVSTAALHGSPRATARAILLDGGRPSDDALVLVAHYLGGALL